MFGPGARTRIQDQLIRYAESDPAVTAAAWTGSTADGTVDAWSDTDLVLAVRGDLARTVDRWTAWLVGEHDAQHHWDLTAAPAVVRVFLLPHWLEIDLTFAPEEHFGPRGHRWQTIFGEARAVERFADPQPNQLTGMVWHHALHAWICLRRDRWWQAEHWISALRDHTLTLACIRLGLPAAYAKGAHFLPAELTVPLEATLVQSLDEPELRRALGAAIEAACAELTRSDPPLAARLNPMLAELT